MKQNIRLKSKYQTALRRYVIEGLPSTQYAGVFGLPIDQLKEWIQAQLPNNISWETFGEKWHLETVIPVHSFGANEMEICFHFLNLRAQPANETRVDLLGANSYFNGLKAQIHHPTLDQLIAKVKALTRTQEIAMQTAFTFAHRRKQEIQQWMELSAEQLDRANRGEDIGNLMAEQVLLKRFGG